MGMRSTQVLVVGAGPFGLSVAAHAKGCGMDVTVVGEPMAFWKHNMPAGMLLRSGLDWHLDTAGIHTLEAFIDENRLPLRGGEPIPVETFRDYAEWFRQSKKIGSEPLRVKRLLRVDEYLEAQCETGETIRANAIVAAPGLTPFINIPSEIPVSLPRERFDHTATLVDFSRLAGKRCLIVGGRQSAFEWAALLIESGAESIDLVFRHDTPRFEPSDWSFTDAIIENTLRVRGWFQHLDPDQQEAIAKQFWTVGRLQLEPWLWPRVNRKNVRFWPNTRVADWRIADDGAIEARLDRGDLLCADHVLFATGYRVDLAKVNYLAGEVASGNLAVSQGFPSLDEDLQTTIPGLYITGQAATRDFGPCFGFVRGCIASARIIVSACQLAT
jgi:cation diffusion facilitator CzcD-associated flavoprotein CzcO